MTAYLIVIVIIIQIKNTIWTSSKRVSIFQTGVNSVRNVIKVSGCITEKQDVNYDI